MTLINQREIGGMPKLRQRVAPPPWHERETLRKSDVTSASKNQRCEKHDDRGTDHAETDEKRYAETPRGSAVAAALRFLRGEALVVGTHAASRRASSSSRRSSYSYAERRRPDFG